MMGFTLICACGQAMAVPETAVGRNGLCPACGAEIAITRDKLQAPDKARRPGGGLLSRSRALQTTTNNENREEAWRKFATAVDLYNNKRFAEALTLLSALQQSFPGNPSIEAAQAQCAEALQEAASPTLTYEGETVPDSALSEELVKGVILKKMLHGGTEEIQLQAAELAARLLGMFTPAPPPTSPAPAPAPEAEPFAPLIFPEERAPENGNGAPKPARRKRTVEEIP